MNFIGLDIQAQHMRLIQLQRLKTGFYMRSAAELVLPAGLMNEGKIKDWDTFRSILNEWVQLLGVTGLPAAISLPVNLVRMQRMRVPLHLSEAEILAAIHAQVWRDLPSMNEALAVDYWLLTQQDGELSFVATRQDYLMQLVDCVTATGLLVKVVDVDIYALQRAICRLLPRAVYAIIYLLNDMAMLLISDTEEIILHKQWVVAQTTDFIAILQKNIIECLAAMCSHQITQCLVCGVAALVKKFSAAQHPDWPLPVLYPDLFAQLELSAQASQYGERPAEFIIACGLAMREIPQW